jgi:hypothetical protein
MWRSAISWRSRRRSSPSLCSASPSPCASCICGALPPGFAFALLARRLAPGNPFYWLSAFAFGAVAPTLVYAFVVSPLKTGAPPPDLPRVFLIGGLLNGAWGVGAATFFAIFQFIRRLRASRG